MIGEDWSDPGFSLPPLAPHTGPFPRADFLAAWWGAAAGDDDELLVVSDGDGLLPAMSNGQVIGFVGHEDLTDYHSPLGRVSTDLVGALAAARPGAAFRFDSLPREAAEPLVAALGPVATGLAMQQHEVAAVLELPASFDAYLGSLGKKERHETRRKRRRFGAEIGEPRLDRAADGSAVARFCAMHRLAGGRKGHFMTSGMEAFFMALHEQTGAVIDMLSGEDGVPVAAAFGFEDEDGYYLYNSAYDPEASHASPGVVLVSMLIERAIEAEKRVFDFLKGDETYKFRLGAAPRPLYEVTGCFA